MKRAIGSAVLFGLLIGCSSQNIPPILAPDSHANDSHGPVASDPFSTRSILSGAVFFDTNGRDSRQAMTSTQNPWSTIGRIWRADDNSTPFIHTCTGTLVGRYLVLTAAHCVLNESGQIRTAHFQPEYKSGESTVESSSTLITVGTTSPETYHANDWAVVVLADPLGDQFGYMGNEGMGDVQRSLPLGVMYAGYSDDFDSGATAGVDMQCYVHQSFSDGTFGNDCSDSPGGSGGPLFRDNGTGGKANFQIANIMTRGATGPFSQYSAAKRANSPPWDRHRSIFLKTLSSYPVSRRPKC